MTQNVARSKLAQYLTLVKVSNNYMDSLMSYRVNIIGWKEKKGGGKGGKSKKYNR